MTQVSRTNPAARVVARGAQEHYAAASPEAYRTALTHLGARAAQAKSHLAAARQGGNAEKIRLARETLVAAYLDLHALKAAVGTAKAAAWQAQGFDVDAAWAASGIKLPKVEDLNRDERIPPITGAGRWAFRGGAAGTAVIATMVVAVAALNGAIPWGPLVRAAELLRAHKLIGLGLAALGGFVAGGPLVDGMNRLLGFKAGPDPLDL